MLQTALGTRGMVTAPHNLAAESGLLILRNGGNAIEAMIAAAATIAVVYPHMNSIGGDGFWLIVPPTGDPLTIRACGGAAQLATREAYQSQGMTSIPFRGPWAANTVAGTVGGWQAALELSRSWGGHIPLAALLADAIHYASQGIPVTSGHSTTITQKWAELVKQPGFSSTFLSPEGDAPKAGEYFYQPRLARTLRCLVTEGLESFYRGSLARTIAADLQQIGSPLSLDDLSRYHAQIVEPLHLSHASGTLYNMSLPTQGVVSLAILGIAERAGLAAVLPDGAAHLHLLVESTKQAFQLRDQFVTDPRLCPVDPQTLLDPLRLDAMARAIDPSQAAPWGAGKGPGDTVWLGAVDGNGLAVSFIQSIYHEFGSGCVLAESGINWQNRGASFSLAPHSLLALEPGKMPFHTLNPAAARLNDGRVMVYGTMGGDGQPQTQAAVFSRHAIFGQPLQQAVTAPRWLLGRTWGQTSDSLKLESRFPEAVFTTLRQWGHEVEALEGFDQSVGHAGAIVRYPDGILEGATDPRSNGGVAAF
ncbi:MAG: gamma-glutamyltransferase family protein [Ferrovum sp.]|nr:gamma-glutamyltransferase family protein [Ferrovum sp.]NDU87639.1 gamma-glutamyltransferase family protein [Ferrovum sp.]